MVPYNSPKVAQTGGLEQTRTGMSCLSGLELRKDLGGDDGPGRNKAVLGGLPFPVIVIALRMSGSCWQIRLRWRCLAPALLDRHHALSFRQPEFLSAIARARQQGESGRVRLTLAGAGQDTIYDVTVQPIAAGRALRFRGSLGMGADGSRCGAISSPMSATNCAHR